MVIATKERIDCGSNVIGLFYDVGTKTYYGTTRGMIHYNGNLTKAHIVPSEPY